MHDAIANFLEDTMGNAVAIQKVVAARLHECLGKKNTVREGCTYSLLLADKSGNVITNL